MEEKIIAFETAKLLKEIGFSVYLKTTYTQYHEEYIYDEDPTHPESYKKDEVRFNNRWYYKNSEDSFSKYFTVYEAPSQSLLQKWLRAIHHMLVIIIPDFYLDGINYNVQVLTYDTDGFDFVSNELSTGSYGDNGEFETYEDALEFGLFKALEKIKVKIK